MPRNKSFLDKELVQHEEIVHNPEIDIVPNRIRIIRIINNMDIKELSAMLNISASMLQQIETQKKPLSVNTLLLISDIFNISTDYILYQTDTIENKNKSNHLTTNIKHLKEFYKKEDKEC